MPTPKSPKLKTVFINATPLEKNMWVSHISRRHGLKLSTWVRRQLNAALDDDLKEILKQKSEVERQKSD